MSRPTTTPLQEEIYEALLPLAYDDPAQDWALLRYCGAIASMLDQVDGYVRDAEDGTPGWCRILDPSTAPEEVLPWIAQIKGVRVPEGLTVSNVRARILNSDGMERGRTEAIVSRARETMTGTKTMYVLERPNGNAYQLQLGAFNSEVPDTAAFQAAAESVKPAGVKIMYVFANAGTYSSLNATYSTYSQVLSTFATYGGVANSTPGT